MKAALRCSVLILLHTLAGATDPLAIALLLDLLPPGSPRCNRGSATFTFDYKPNPENKWDVTAQHLEETLFLAEMKHVDTNPNRTWTLRIGEGSNMYSFIGAYGESVPPQYHRKGEFVDEVWQNVVVADANDPATGKAWFIHQAGTYAKGDRRTPYFSPNLAHFCSGNQCSSASWGQQAHLPTGFGSSAIFLNRYKDCGDGVVELTSAIHNDAAGGDDFTYTNVPWGGVRTSTLRDVVMGNKDAPGGSLKDPLWPWSEEPFVPNLQDTGGYTAFAQSLLPKPLGSFSMPDGLNIVIKSVCAESVGHSEYWHRLVVYCKIEDTVTVSTGSTASLTFANPRTGRAIPISGVHHWAWNGNTIYFFPPSLAEFNQIFSPGDNVRATIRNTNIPVEDNLALSFVHGSHPKASWDRKDPRVRIGRAGAIQSRRDYTVFTINTIANIARGDTYVQRQYMVTDRYIGLDERSREWAKETMRDKYPVGSGPRGRRVRLYLSADQNTFTAAVGRCPAEETCVGWTTPKQGSVAFFAVECGDQFYVGSDQYYFSPKGNAVQSWVCNSRFGVEPKQRLLGYFVDGSCTSLRSAKFGGVKCPSVCDRNNPEETFIIGLRSRLTKSCLEWVGNNLQISDQFRWRRRCNQPIFGESSDQVIGRVKGVCRVECNMIDDETCGDQKIVQPNQADQGLSSASIDCSASGTPSRFTIRSRNMDRGQIKEKTCSQIRLAQCEFKIVDTFGPTKFGYVKEACGGKCSNEQCL